ncbi:MAG: cytochrome c peroxidase [Chitinophagales bacterium]
MSPLYYYTRKVGLLLLCLSLLNSCTKENNELDNQLETTLAAASKGQGLSFFQLPANDDLAAIPQDPKNPITKEKVILGKFLFHETGIAINPKHPEGAKTYSCASCHHAKAGFQACRIQGVGEGGMGFGISGESRVNNPDYLNLELDVQPLRTPSALNIAYQTNVLWNGQFGGTALNEGTEDQWTEETPKAVNHLGYEGTEIQAIAGLAVHRMAIKNSIAEMSNDYQGLFETAFSDFPEADRYSKETAGLAIAAYERTLLANEAPFQEWLKGNTNALTDAQKRGAVLFFGKAQCNACHTGAALSSMAFYALGMEDLQGFGVYGAEPQEGDKQGRGGFTKRPEDMYKFKVPQLYNLKDSPFYGHGGTFRSVEEVVRYKNEAIPSKTSVPKSQLADEFVPLGLSEQEIRDIADFIENGLHDPNLHRYVPESLPSGNCFPNNDAVSKSDLGCG